MRRRSASAIAPVLIAGALIAAGLPSTVAAAAEPVQRASLPVIERQVMCVTCKIPLNVAQSPQADRERAFIQSLIEQGQSEAQIKRALVAQYGPAVLGLPSSSGFDVTAYMVPIAVVVALIAMLGLLLPRWRRRARARPTGEERAELDPTDAARLESDLARYD